MTREEIIQALRKGYFGEYIREIDFLLSECDRLETSIDEWKRDWKLEMAHSNKCEERIRELEEALKNSHKFITEHCPNISRT